MGSTSAVISVASGIDVAGDVTPYVDQIKAAGIDVVFRYYATHTHLKGKILTVEEARAISAAGLKIGAVWENGEPTTAEYFTTDQGRADAAGALDVAARIGQPANTPIYFAADCDLSYAHISTWLFNYFVGIRAVFIASGLGYQVGVYGSGLVCEKMTDWVLASYSWLAGAKDWQGYESFMPRATIIQTALPHALRGIGLPESDSDGDTTTTPDYGGFQVPVVTTA
jgi:hypothetical protein